LKDFKIGWLLSSVRSCAGSMIQSSDGAMKKAADVRV